jgi:hypothetical protein
MNTEQSTTRVDTVVLVAAEVRMDVAASASADQTIHDNPSIFILSQFRAKLFS